MSIGSHILVHSLFSWRVKNTQFEELVVNSINSLVNEFRADLLERFRSIDKRSEILLLIQTFCQSNFGSCIPIAHHKALVTHDVSEVLGKKFLISTSVDTVNKVIATHKRAYTSIDGGLERRVVHFKVGTLIDLFIYLLSMGLLRVVSEVLDISHHFLGLDSLDDGTDHFGANDWVFTAQVLKITTSVRDSLNIDSWSEVYMSTFIEELFSHGLAQLLT